MSSSEGTQSICLHLDRLLEHMSCKAATGLTHRYRTTHTLHATAVLCAPHKHSVTRQW
jgi:hypothetical protein